ncbi:hypothetical protein [Lentibacillus amyloliquefaciens]|uniref:Uncharacterized protein n=1 Tax=Lentibacillus amyloliquefaciens TaxID=1472767 RepID=A0A0U3W8R8_9BACI|nr:hypothetical protein [Lentibacillus amyloliquefaciens]ALX49488.1 hypothetical protein AOX59_13470 [Lentibacillus amyloliquefaciens]
MCNVEIQGTIIRFISISWKSSMDVWLVSCSNSKYTLYFQMKDSMITICFWESKENGRKTKEF